MMTRRLGRVLGLVACGLWVLPMTSVSAAGAAVTAIGWWSQRPGAAELPEGGFELSLSPAGPLSQAALRIKVDSVQLTSALLELTESSAAGAEVAAVVACTTTDAWTPANPGAWQDAPAPNCARNAPLSRNFSGEWSGDIESLLTVGTASIVLVPMSHADTQGAPIPYQLVFSEARLIATAPEPPAPTAPPSDQAGAEPTPDAQPPAVVGPTDPRPDGAGSSPPPVAVQTVAPDTENLPTVAGDEDDGDATKRPWWRVAILVPLAGMCGAGAVFARRTARARGLLKA